MGSMGSPHLEAPGRALHAADGSRMAQECPHPHIGMPASRVAGQAPPEQGTETPPDYGEPAATSQPSCKKLPYTNLGLPKMRPLTFFYKDPAHHLFI